MLKDFNNKVKKEGKRDGNGREMMGQDGLRQDKKGRERMGMGQDGKREEKRREAKEWNRTELKRQGKEVTG